MTGNKPKKDKQELKHVTVYIKKRPTPKEKENLN